MNTTDSKNYVSEVLSHKDSKCFHYLLASLEEVIDNRTLIEKDIMEIPSYCLNISNPTAHDKELGDLRQQLIFWVEG